MRKAAWLIAVLSLLAAAYASAEIATVTYTEPDESEATGTGEANLKDCTVHWCVGETCTDWYAARTVAASSADGGEERVVTVQIPLQQGTNLTRRFAVTCTNTDGNETSFIVGSAGGTNPLTFE